MELLGCLLYLCLTRPDIWVMVSELSKYNSDPGMPMWNALVHLVRYLLKTSALRLVFRASKLTGVDLKGFSDAGFHGSADTTRSRCGYLIFFCSCLIAYKSSLQKVTAHSTCEAEFLAASMATREIVYDD